MFQQLKFFIQTTVHHISFFLKNWHHYTGFPFLCFPVANLFPMFYSGKYKGKFLCFTVPGILNEAIPATTQNVDIEIQNSQQAAFK